jgi:amino acid adenylation domain-containing protein
MDRSAELIICLLGILKAGGAYVPLDTASPPDRLALMLEESASTLVLTRTQGVKLLARTSARVIDFDTIDFATGDAASLNLQGAGADRAYVIFTSGSTGKPKGVAVTHRGVARLVIQSDYVRFGPDDVVAHASNVAFDAATFEIWGALLNGGKLVIIPRDVLLSSNDLATFLNAHHVTTLFLTTSLFNQMALENPAAFRSLKNLVFGGEAGNPDCVRRVLAQGAPERLVNGYGPTEATTFAICHHVRALPADAITVPIGRPIANTTIHLLDPRLQPVPSGAIGEIFIGGPGVAIGYVNDPALTAERFVETPFGRLYRTGDLARRRTDGNIDYCGRMDAQLKLRGFRIEPGEIETALQQHPQVRHAAIVAHTEAHTAHALIAYLVAQGGKQVTAAELRAFLALRLPAYMIPSTFVWMEALPLTANGKLDQRALPAPTSESKPTREYVPPQNSVHAHLIEIWEEVLDRKPIGIRDDFFELGGHSLLAARVIALTTERLGHRLPFAEFFANPTIEAHTRSLFNTQVAVQQIPYALINPDGKQTPVFFFHGDFVGGGFFCKTLASVIGADRPFYALHPHGLQGDAVPLTIEEMATGRLKQIREIQPHGPYIIGGYCNGALTAFQTARLLREAGEEVATLLMLNADGTNVRFRWLKQTMDVSGTLRGDDEARTLRRFLQSQRRLSDFESIGSYYVRAAADWLKQPTREQIGRLWRKAGRILGRPLRANASALARKTAPASPPTDGAVPPGPLGDAYNDACLAYVPLYYDGPMILLWPREEPPPSRGPAAGWEKVCSQISIVEVPGHHHSCISVNANVVQVGQAMRKAIDQAGSLLSST